MRNETSHPAEQELLLAADGELSARRAGRVHTHLAACWSCRARMAEIEGKIADFVRTYHHNLDPQVPPIDGSRAQLRVELAELATQSHTDSRRRFFHFPSPARAIAYICAAFLLAAVGGPWILQHLIRRGQDPAAIVFARQAIPNPSLTPGFSRQIAVSEVCAMAHEEVVRAVPNSLRQEVLQEYGIVNARADDYEIDYLIAPGLGGEEDIRNLWPEPYRSPTWNAHVKDDLEERLHQLVCSGKLDVSAAQRDIATNWIAAYKKYFHTDRPLLLNSESIRSGSFTLAPRWFWVHG